MLPVHRELPVLQDERAGGRNISAAIVITLRRQAVVEENVPVVVRRRIRLASCQQERGRQWPGAALNSAHHFSSPPGGADVLTLSRAKVARARAASSLRWSRA